ncbi:AAA family ATPase [Pedobacter sp. UBA4863]|uniref:AAA family ATPase n=1 Tax=Pedobacter sp. UBA4863 TaxID=1947060 RepID=UPI0025F0B868|nr:AAA family ATPase [Pedobacter sp. UBA4863]
MQLQKAQRKKTKIKMAIQGSSGSGKTYSSLLLAYGLCKDWTKIGVIDTENGSADLYSHLGEFNCVTLQAPYSPENYIQAIDLCVKSNIEVIIIDSISHCWDYLLELHSNMTGNSFTNWGKINPKQNAFINAILKADAHVISNMRVKQDYVLTQKEGKYVPEKIGLKAVQREGVDYEFTIVFDINSKHKANCTKDRTNLFLNQPEFIINSDIGAKILKWCNETSISNINSFTIPS